jgi:hypothetical protein
MLRTGRLTTLLIALLFLGMTVAAQGNPSGETRSSSKAQSAKSTAATPDAPAVHPEQWEAMQTDAKKMRVILNQMRTNLAFVQDTQTPLKHQFELEIDMWQVLLDQMDRRIAEMGYAVGAKSSK